MLKILEKQPFFRADMAGLGIYHMGGYGRIGVYRVNDKIWRETSLNEFTEYKKCVWLLNRSTRESSPVKEMKP